MSTISTHVLDTSLGRPAADVTVLLEVMDDEWEEVSVGVTDKDGRCRLTDVADEGTYRLTFATGLYFMELGAEVFYPFVTIAFEVEEKQKYHVPLLLNPFGYTTYRGS